MNGERRPRLSRAPLQTTAGEHDVTAVTVTPPADLTSAQAWAAAWLTGPHTEPGCPTCSAGWALIGGGPRG